MKDHLISPFDLRQPLLANPVDVREFMECLRIELSVDFRRNCSKGILGWFRRILRKPLDCRKDCLNRQWNWIRQSFAVESPNGDGNMSVLIHCESCDLWIGFDLGTGSVVEPPFEPNRPVYRIQAVWPLEQESGLSYEILNY